MERTPYTVSRDRAGDLSANSRVPLGFDRRELRITTTKGARGLYCSAQCVRVHANGSGYEFAIGIGAGGDFRRTLAGPTAGRATERAIRAMHEAATADLRGVIYAALEFYAGQGNAEARALLGAAVDPAGRIVPPAHVAARMVDLARVGRGDRVLEPSAGTGALLLALGEWTLRAGRVYAIETVGAMSSALRSRFDQVTVTQADFLTVAPETYRAPFDVVLMNPPFKDAADVRHILHARRFLAPGGRLVAICAAGPRQHEALQPLADSWEYLPPDTFAGTSVRAVLLTMGAAATRSPHLSTAPASPRAARLSLDPLTTI